MKLFAAPKPLFIVTQSLATLVALAIGFQARAQFVAFNDHAAGAGTHVNATRWNAFNILGGAPGNAGSLRNIATGASLPVTMSIVTNNGAAAAGTGASPATGTPVYQVFNGFVDFAGTPNPSIELSGAASITYIFSNLNTNSSYSFKGTAIRGGAADYSNRWTLVEITGANSFTASHTAHVLASNSVPVLLPNQCAINTGLNNGANQGDYAGYENIRPAANGTFSITCRQYTGTVPGGSSAGTKGYGITGIRLEELVAVDCSTPLSIATPPQSQSLSVGSTLGLGVGVNGAAPFRYQWFHDNVVIAAGTNATYVRTNAQFSDAGNYHVVVSNCFGAVTSSVAQVGVFSPPYVVIGLTNQFWNYDQSGNDLGTAWKEVGFDDSSWPTGRAVLAFESATAVTPLTNTVLTLSNAFAPAPTMTFYFRTHFMLTNAPENITVLTSNLIDDGAIFYCNGQEYARFNMQAGFVTAATLALGASAEGVFSNIVVPSAVLQQGDNVLAVEVHQASAASSDIVMGLAMFATELAPAPPTIVSPPTNTIGLAGSTTLLDVAAIGRSMQFQWFHDGTAIADGTNRTLRLANTPFSASGNYFVVVSNVYGATTSSVAVLTVIGGEPKLRLVEFTNTWRYDQSGNDLGTSWRLAPFNDTAWPLGTGVLAAASSGRYPEPLNTALSLRGGNQFSVVTYYFRTHFTAPTGLSNVVLVASNLLDDGAVFYINGTEASRIRLSGAINASAFASVSPNNGSTYETVLIPPAGLVPGDNVLAVEVHQSGPPVSSDVIFGMNLALYGTTNQGLVITRALQSQSLQEGNALRLGADVVGAFPIAMQWFHGSSPIPGATNVTLNIPEVHAADAGNYFFIASNAVNAVTSSVASVRVAADITVPVVLNAFGTSNNSVVVVFSESVSAQSATNISNYIFSPAVTILGAELMDTNKVLLHTAGIDVQFDYALQIANVTDRADAVNLLTVTNTAVQPYKITTAMGLQRVQTVFVILMENVSWSNIKGNSSAPYFNSLLPKASYCEAYFGHDDKHPSEPNYIWLEAGDDFGYEDDSGPAIDRVSSTNHLSTQLANAGIEWRGYMEDLPYGSTGIANALPYLARHNPFAFFDDVTTNYSYCTNHVRPYAEFAGDLAEGRIGRYNFITPNIYNDMHNLASGSTNRITQGDDWLARELPQILNSSAFSNNGAVFITWDENDYTPDAPIGMIVLSPLAKGNGYASPVFYDHSSTLRTMQEIFGVRPFLGDAANASPLNDLFLSLSLKVSKTNEITSVAVQNSWPGATNYVQVSSNLVNWTTISTNVGTNVVTVIDPAGSQAPQRFYRSVEKR